MKLRALSGRLPARVLLLAVCFLYCLRRTLYFSALDVLSLAFLIFHTRIFLLLLLSLLHVLLPLHLLRMPAFSRLASKRFFSSACSRHRRSCSAICLLMHASINSWCSGSCRVSSCISVYSLLPRRSCWMCSTSSCASTGLCLLILEMFFVTVYSDLYISSVVHPPWDCGAGTVVLSAAPLSSLSSVRLRSVRLARAAP